MDFKEEIRKARRSPVYWFYYFELAFSEYWFCLKCRLLKRCDQCNAYLEVQDTYKRTITSTCILNKRCRTKCLK